MNPHARSGYAQATTPTRTDRGLEYAVFAQATHRLSAVDEKDKTQFPALADAIAGNQRLWGVLAEDLMLETNQLPASLRGQLIGLAEFVRQHSMRVLAGRGSVAPLIDINTAIMKGLRGEVEEAA
jgi:flagellar biosynthesis activator protein FlaF